MFFVASKLFWMFASPMTLLVAGAFVGALLSTLGRGARFGRRLALVCATLLLLASATPVGMALIGPLENRFPLPPQDMPAPVGVIILGGTVDDALSAARGETVFDEDGGRLTEAVALARRYPSARIVYSGGSASLGPSPTTEAGEARKLLVALGVAPERITLEDRSRNTDENARFSAQLLKPRPGERWLIVTSGYHMPRSMGLFVKAGFAAVAYPVDYRTYGDTRDRHLGLDPAHNLRTVEIAAHEWIGLFAYWVSGRIDHLFPGPDDAR